MALKAASKRHLCPSQGSVFAQVSPYHSIRMHVFHPSQNPGVKTGEKEIILKIY